MKIWSVWLQGRNNAPKQVQKIFELWEELNPNSEFRVLEHDEVDSILRKLGVNVSRMTPQVKANITRTYLLASYGGAWVDATLLPTRPLENWLTPELRREGFFAFRSTGRPELVLQNWFIYAEENNSLINSWLSLYCDYFRVERFPQASKRIFLTSHLLDYFRFKNATNRRDFLYFVDPDRGRSCRMYPYALHNFTLAYLLKTDKSLAELWGKVPVKFHIQPSLVGYSAADADTPDEMFLRLALEILPSSPVHKLSHHYARFENLIDQAKSNGLIEFSDGC